MTQVSPPRGAPVTMGSVTTMTFRVTNTRNSRKIVAIKFSLQRGRDIKGGSFLSGTALPGGWISTGRSGKRSMTFKATSWNDAIDVGGTKEFTLTLRAGSAPRDISQTLRKVEAAFSERRMESRRKESLRDVGSWTLKSLEITSFQTVNMTGSPVVSQVAGQSFRLVATVVNRSTARQAGITTSPQPPAVTKSGTVTLPNSPLISYRPQPLTLRPGEQGTITFAYTTSPTDIGAVTFTAFARDYTGLATSVTSSSNTLVISRFIASIAVVPSCVYDAQNFTVVLRLSNGYTYDIVDITPRLSSSVGAPIRYLSGPTPSRINTLNAGESGVSDNALFAWRYQISGGTPGDTFTFTGSATGTGRTEGRPSLTTPDVTSPTTKRGGHLPTVRPSTTNAASANQELTWSFTNENGCGPIRRVSILIPSGWLWGRDAYSIVEQVSPPNPDSVPTESWVVSGSNPVIFTAPDGRELQIGKSASFSIVFLKTPAAAGVYNFDLTITDASGASEIKPTSVTVQPFNSGGGNATDTKAFREDFE